MARKKAKVKKAKRKCSKRKGKIEKYRPEMCETVKWLIVEMGAVNARGDIAWGKIVKALGVTNKTVIEWRKRTSKYYKPDFARAVNEAIEEIDAGKIKRSMIQRAQGYTRVKRITETRDTPDGESTVERVEREKLKGDVAAAKLVLPNIGSVRARWMVKEGRVHDTTGELTRLLDQIGRQTVILPSEETEVMPEYEQSGDRSGQPAVAPEQPVLDNG